jgi:hypothetical protein
VPPIDLKALAYEMGVDEIRDADLIEDGRLEHEPGRVVVYLRSAAPRRRRTFTLAHELGHVLLADPHSTIVARRWGLDDSRVERFCDAFAAAVLMPAEWVRAEYTGQPQRLATARHLSDAAETSLAASVVRLHDIVGWHVSLLRWKRIDDRWRFVSGAAVERELHGTIRSAAATSVHLERLGAAGQGDRFTQLPLVVGGREVSVPAQVAVSRATTVALADLTH